MQHLHRFMEPYLNVKKLYVKDLNTFISPSPALQHDVNHNVFGRVDQLLPPNELFEASKTLEQLFFSDGLDEEDRRNIAIHILYPNERNEYMTPNDAVLIRKFDLPFIRHFLRMEIARVHVGSSGFKGLADTSLFNEILRIENDVFVLHSGVTGAFKFNRHCPLIMELITWMNRHKIPFHASKIIELCTSHQLKLEHAETRKLMQKRQQEDHSFNFTSMDHADGVTTVSKEGPAPGGRRRKKRKSRRRRHTKRMKK